MHKPYKKITAQLLLFSFLLESCYNPNIGIGKQALPTPDPADKQRQYAGEPHDKYPPSHTLTTADKHPITFTYHNGQWQAAIKEYAAHGSSQHRQLPVVFERGFTLQDVVDSNPTEQKLLLHLCPSQEEPDQPSYVYVGRTPSQAKPHPQLLSSPAARQTTPPSAVGLAQQQATAQPRQGRTSPQQAQEQPGPQAVLALPSPVQQIGESPRSQGHLPTTPARATSKPLPAPSRETPRQRVVQKQPTSPQRAPTRRAFSLRNQYELLHSQRVAQAKRAQSAAMAKPGNQLAQPAAPSQAIVSLTPAHPPSLSDKAPPGIASQNLLAQGGHPVRFMHRDGQWWASVRERIGAFYRVWVLPVACQGHGDVAKALADLQDKPTQYTQRRIHVMHTQQIPYVPQFVYLGTCGLKGGMYAPRNDRRLACPQATSYPRRIHVLSSRQRPPYHPMVHLGTCGLKGGRYALFSERSQLLAASQDREASLVTLHERMAQEDIKSTKDLVKALNAAQPAEQQALQQWIERYIKWFNEQTEHVGNLALIPEAIQEYTCLARIKANTEKNRRLLASYFDNLCNKVKQGQYGEKPLIEALEYTLQNLDSDVFGGDPSKLITLGEDLLAKLDAGRNAFIKETYPTDRSTLYALHQALVLIQQIAPGRLNPNQENGLYSRFKVQIQAIAASSAYYPIRYHALLLEQSLQPLESAKDLPEDIRRRVGHGLKGAIYLGQVARALSELNFNVEDFLKGCANLQEAFTRQGIAAKSWYDTHQLMHYASLLSLQDSAQYRVFEEHIQSLKSQEAGMREKDRTALRFGIVQQLGLLALHGPSGEVRKKSIQWLEHLANPEAWGGDPAVMEGLLDGLAEIAVHSQGAEKGQAQAALASLTEDRSRVRHRDKYHLNPTVREAARREEAVQAAVRAWLGGQRLAAKLSAIKSAPAATPAAGGLFRVIHDALREMAPAGPDPADAQAARQALRAYYQQPSFAQVGSLFDRETPKHVDSLQCQLMLTEQVKVKAEDKEQEGAQRQKDDLSTHHERLEWVKNPIALEDLFKKRKTKPDGPEKEIQKVLLVGEPGTGKTTLSKKIAYR